MAQLTRAEPLAPPERLDLMGEVHAWRLIGALFFGSATMLESIQDALPQRALVLDLAGVICMDTAGAERLPDRASASAAARAACR